ncbi:MAG TPA: MFS transporter [Aliidongia sp.]|nr:MFS transporter [Aliidongia sp.]
MFEWFTGLNAGEKRTFWACFGGWALDALDVQIYSFVAPILITVWHVTAGDIGQAAFWALFTSAFGGWITGLFSDRIGRVRMLQITIIWFAFFTALSGLTENLTQLIIVRACQGLGFGGEWAAGAVLMGEVIAAKHRGKAVGTVQAGWAVGWGLAAIASAVLQSFLPPEYAWRGMFLIGLVPALLVFFIRRFVSEPAVFVETQKQIAQKGGSGILAIFEPGVIGTTLLASLLATGAQGGYYSITTFLPLFLKTERHISVTGSSLYLAIIITASFLGYVTSAYLADALGRRLNFILFAVLSAITVAAYMIVPINDSVMLVLGFPLGFFSAGIFSGMGPFLTEIFPSRMRGSGQGFCYNVGRAVGAAFPWLVGSLKEELGGLGIAIGVFAVGAYAVMALAALLLPETRGKTLQAYE